MEKIKFVKSILDILGDMVIEHEEYEPDTLTMLVKDVNAVVGGKPIDIYIKEGLEAKGFKDISFSYGDGDWMTVHKN